MERNILTAFVREHLNEDPVKLLLQQQRYPHIDLREVAQQLEGKKQALTKWPTLALFEEFIYPPKLNREQSSSEATARYKANIFQGKSLADLTGGMGIDSFFFAQKCEIVNYVEQQTALFNTTRNNFLSLGTKNITCHCNDSIKWIKGEQYFDLIYIDPARRDSQGHKVSAFEECTPNLLENREMLLGHCHRLMVKASPMIDVNLATQQLKSVEEIHIVAVGNECKEVLFILQKSNQPTALEKIPIHCINLHNSGEVQYSNVFTKEDESVTQAQYCSEIRRYLYEPHSALMKGGCYNSICNWYGIEKLARNTHLYTSDKLIETFPGRRFEVLQELSLNKKSIAQVLPEKQAHVIERNFPMTATDLQRKLGLKEGGTFFVVAATMNCKRMGWLCRVDF